MDPHERWRRYQSYLRSPLWTRYIRPTTFYLADWLCQANKPGCVGSADECHHTTYAFWEQRLDRPGETTMAVCRVCHRWIHRRPIIIMPDPANDNLLWDEPATRVAASSGKPP
jgi:hypothetical protein